MLATVEAPEVHDVAEAKPTCRCRKGHAGSEAKDIAEFGCFWGSQVHGDPKARVRIRRRLKINARFRDSKEYVQTHALINDAKAIAERIREFINAHDVECSCPLCAYLEQSHRFSIKGDSIEGLVATARAIEINFDLLGNDII